MNQIHESFKHGKNFKIGNFCIIHENVVVGDDVTIMNYVELRPGTVIGNNCYLDSMVCLTGDATLGNNVVMRHKSGLGRNVIVEDDVFISPSVTVLAQDEKQVLQEETIIGKGAFLGCNVVVQAGVKIGPGVVIGISSLVNKDCPEGVYVGIPAKKIR
jgi:UDP-N-acetylglucosamine acyltransferase